MGACLPGVGPWVRKERVQRGAHDSLRALDCADEFIDLQEARHKADYDPRLTFTRVEALEWTSRAEGAIAKLRAAPRPDRKAFAVQLLLKKRSGAIG